MAAMVHSVKGGQSPLAEPSHHPLLGICGTGECGGAFGGWVDVADCPDGEGVPGQRL